MGEGDESQSMAVLLMFKLLPWI